MTAVYYPQVKDVVIVVPVMVAGFIFLLMMPAGFVVIPAKAGIQEGECGFSTCITTPGME